VLAVHAAKEFDRERIGVRDDSDVFEFVDPRVIVHASTFVCTSARRCFSLSQALRSKRAARLGW
jgi:hypothetical protein